MYVQLIPGFNAPHGISTRSMGNMGLHHYGEYGVDQTRKNRKNFFNEIGVGDRRVITMLPQHKSSLVYLDELTEYPDEIECDALITKCGRYTLCVTPADCFAGVITNNKGSFKAVSHLGKGGILDGIMFKILCLILFGGLVDHSLPFESNASDVIIGISPGVCARCYIVDKPERELEFFVQYNESIFEMIKSQIEDSGVPESNVYILNHCTACLEDGSGGYKYFSHSRALRTKEHDGRNAVVAWL